jgi:RimJ/RimL family protein N-acetyltransferase
MGGSESSGMRVRHVGADESEHLREIRLASLETDPHAFGGTHAHEAGLRWDWWTNWASKSELGTSQRTFVLEARDGSWLGLALVRLDDETENAAVLNAMWVVPEARGRGAAGMLCEACATWAAAHGCRELTLTIMVENHTARHAYEAADFAVCGEATWERDGEILDQFVMARSLNPQGDAYPDSQA